MKPFPRPSQVFKFFFASYVTIAVFYTTNHLFVSPLRAGLSVLVNHPLSPRALWTVFVATKSDEESKKLNEARAYGLDPHYLQFSGGETKWESSAFALEHGLGQVDPIIVDEELTLSKAFSTAMRPSKIIPYFFRASGEFEPDDITVTTLVTSSRLGAFNRLVDRYQGTS